MEQTSWLHCLDDMKLHSCNKTGEWATLTDSLLGMDWPLLVGVRVHSGSSWLVSSLEVMMIAEVKEV